MAEPPTHDPPATPPRDAAPSTDERLIESLGITARPWSRSGESTPATDRRERDVEAFVPECSRCGYDLSALPSTWEELCPVEGRCSECGLEFRWGDVLGGPEPVPHWFVEAPLRETAHRYSMLRRLVSTWPRVLGPASFWRQVRLEHRVRIQALVAVWALCLALLHFAGSSWVIATLSGFGRGRQRGMIWSDMVEMILWPFPFATNPWFWIGIATALISPLVFLTLPTTLATARVKFTHVLRAGAYASLGAISIALIFRLTRIAIVLLQPPRGQRGPRSFWDELALVGFRSSWGMAAALIWLAVFWWYAVGKYMRLPRAGAVTASIWLIAFLSAVALVQFWPGSNWEWYRQSLRGAFWR